MRKGNAVKRDVLPDPIYNSKLVTRLINKIMLDGKKGTAQNILYSAFKKIEDKTGKPAMDVFATALNNIMPTVELKMRRVGGSNFQVPTEVTPDRKVTLGLRWLVNYSRLRNEKKERRYSQDGRSQQSLRPLSLVIVEVVTYGKS